MIQIIERTNYYAYKIFLWEEKDGYKGAIKSEHLILHANSVLQVKQLAKTYLSLKYKIPEDFISFYEYYPFVPIRRTLLKEF